MIKRLVRGSIRRSLRNDHVRRVVAAEIAAMRPPAVPAPVVDMGSFVDGHGVSHPLDPTLRDKLKSGWRTMVDPVAVVMPPTDQDLRGRATRAEKVVAEAARLVEAIAGVPLDGAILEIGCYDGSAAFQLARDEGRRVVASDLARYYVVQRPAEPTDADVEAQQLALAELRERARVVAGVAVDRVTFVEDDITSSVLEPGSLDSIVSFEVLEHVQRPAAAFAAMARLLKPGGIAYHDYNPFFSVNGGHSLCTLDFPWGHARLDPGDFERYVREIRPTEAPQALRFYRESLNRLTLVELRATIAAAGLELLAVIPWFERTLVPRLTPDVVAEVRRSYPTVGTDDLLATFVAVVVRRPLQPDR
jgi:SAM-dependent methyltransferase